MSTNSPNVTSVPAPGTTSPAATSANAKKPDALSGAAAAVAAAKAAAAAAAAGKSPSAGSSTPNSKAREATAAIPPLAGLPPAAGADAKDADDDKAKKGTSTPKKGNSPAAPPATPVVIPPPTHIPGTPAPNAIAPPLTALPGGTLPITPAPAPPLQSMIPMGIPMGGPMVLPPSVMATPHLPTGNAMPIDASAALRAVAAANAAGGMSMQQITDATAVGVQGGHVVPVVDPATGLPVGMPMAGILPMTPYKPQHPYNGDDEDEEGAESKIAARRRRNATSAKLHRQRKKAYIETLKQQAAQFDALGLGVDPTLDGPGPKPQDERPLKRARTGAVPGAPVVTPTLNAPIDDEEDKKRKRRAYNAGKASEARSRQRALEATLEQKGSALKRYFAANPAANGAAAALLSANAPSRRAKQAAAAAAAAAAAGQVPMMGVAPPLLVPMGLGMPLTVPMGSGMPSMPINANTAAATVQAAASAAAAAAVAAATASAAAAATSSNGGMPQMQAMPIPTVIAPVEPHRTAPVDSTPQPPAVPTATA